MTEGVSGELAAALAKAQAAFPAISRDKEVTVQSKSGASYKFKYAPLDSILAAVRSPLAANGLAIVQTLDGGDLVTMLLHSSGERIEGRTPLPHTEGVQAFGSAITYLRRYSIQALLAIAAEEDDDGNRAAGNDATFAPRPRSGVVQEADRKQFVNAGTPPDRQPYNPPREDGGLIGTVEVGSAKDSDLELRQTPEGPAIGFRLKGDKGGIKVIARGDLADTLAMVKSELVGQRVTCWGRVSDETFTPKGTQKKVTYQVLALERIQAPEFTLPAPEAPPYPMIDEQAEAELDAAVGA